MLGTRSMYRLYAGTARSHFSAFRYADASWYQPRSLLGSAATTTWNFSAASAYCFAVIRVVPSAKAASEAGVARAVETDSSSNAMAGAATFFIRCAMVPEIGPFLTGWAVGSLM